MIMDGKKVAGQVALLLQERLQRAEKVPALGIVLVGDDPASLQYVRTKQKFGEKIGVPVRLIELPRGTGEGEVLDAIAHLLSARRVLT